MSFYEADGLGSITSLTNSAGTLANTYMYDSFGRLIASTGTAINPFQFTGRENDSETALYYYRARYFDSNVGRFLNEDPKRFFSGPNSYTYVKNSSPNLVDAFGLAGSHPQSLDGAWNQARMLLSDPDCAKFLKDLLINLHDVPNLDLFLQNFDNTNFGFNPTNDPFPNADSYIGHVDNITLSPSNNTVHIHPGARGAANCCILGVTLLHEVLHTYPYAFTDFDIAQAVGYQGSAANGIKPASRYFSQAMEDHCLKACKK